MARVVKILTAANEEIKLDVRTDKRAVAGVQYGAGGLGTIVLEGRILDAEWVAIGLQSPADANAAAAANLAAAGAGSADVSWCEEVRVRKSVAGAGPVTVGFTINEMI